MVVPYAKLIMSIHLAGVDMASWQVAVTTPQQLLLVHQDHVYNTILLYRGQISKTK
jgi:hypothetical protein